MFNLTLITFAISLSTPPNFIKLLRLSLDRTTSSIILTRRKEKRKKKGEEKHRKSSVENRATSPPKWRLTSRRGDPRVAAATGIVENRISGPGWAPLMYADGHRAWKRGLHRPFPSLTSGRTRADHGTAWSNGVPPDDPRNPETR